MPAKLREHQIQAKRTVFERHWYAFRNVTPHVVEVHRFPRARLRKEWLAVDNYNRKVAYPHHPGVTLLKETKAWDKAEPRMWPAYFNGIRYEAVDHERGEQ